MTDTPEMLHEDMQGGDAIGARLPQYRTLSIESSSKNKVIWLISFTDLMGIVLAFFVLLYTMSSPGKPTEMKGVSPSSELIKPLSEMSDFPGSGGQAGPVDSISLNKIDFNRALDPGYLKSVLESLTAETPILQKTELIMDTKNNRLILALPQAILFEKGKTEISPAGKEAVRAVTGVLKHIRNGIEVIGHADPTMAAGGGGATNWDISLSRAVTVAGLMSAEGYPRSLPVKGMSSALYAQLPDSIPEDQRKAMSRRVDIVINMHDNSTQQRFGIGPQ